MVKPFIGSELFEINKNFNIVEVADQYVIIDNWYTNLEKIQDLLYSAPTSSYSSVDRVNKINPNWIDYYECRTSIELFSDELFLNQYGGLILDLCDNFFPSQHNRVIQGINPFLFNYFKHIKNNISSSLQHYPHIDSDLASIIYIDKQSSGGTALYFNFQEPKDPQYNFLYDVSSLQKKIIPSKPNRLVIFNSKIYHGGYINDHKVYENNWRINQVFFLEKDTE